ncbi:MAG: amidohydrolase family protein, partial [Gemmatirosa sp.]
MLRAQVARPAPADSTSILLRPDAVWDGEADAPRAGWVVLVRGERIAAVGPSASVTAPAGARVVPLPGTTLMPGMIDAHSHVLLHAYDETSWDDQVLKEPLSLRVARAVNHLRATLQAGFTTLRDLGTEGADDADTGLKQAVEQGIVPGPRLIVANRAIVATGSYAPRGFDPRWPVPQGAEEADGADALVRTIRAQIGRGADVIKLYGDYRWGPRGEARPTFSEAELRLAVETAASSGRPVVVHASTAEGMRRATVAGVQTIEHGDDGTPEVFRLMAQRGVALCPTIAAGDAVSRYRGWTPGVGAEPARITAKRASVKAAVAAGVTICNGSDVGVFTHGDNAREPELLVAYGHTPLQAARAATSVTARAIGLTD